MTVGSVGCAVAGTVAGPQALFSVIAVVLAASTLLIRPAGRSGAIGVNLATPDRLMPGNIPLVP